ncbi:GMC family oxidoreductase [Sinomonas sp. JGH33]|uniref:GMC family oxidoreductase n=1 Tax=Sinomonas terricola TaxID=3110330 RepID=A0ABU5T157_9MICC|nr:GMC family oxidoreductase [Sinomonas sp. JGH33]MEA5453390.1 GMC family oxidoreductase [Sinomonas sp. JGH33]
MTTIDARSLPGGSRIAAQIVIVGTGPCGMTVARELAPTGADIVLLEGGGTRPDAVSQDTLRGDSASQSAEPLDKARQKGLGGTSRQWGGRTAPFDALDFEPRRELGASGWPLSRDDLMPYYRRAAVALDLGRFEWTAGEALPGHAAHLTGRPGADLADTGIWRFSPPVRFGDVYRRELEGLPNVRLFHHANVTRLRRTAEDGRICAVEAATGEGRHLEFCGGVVVVAAGGLETARLLLASGIGNEHDQLGRNYMIHPIAEVGLLRLRDPRSVGAAAGYVKSRDGVWVRRLLQLDERLRRREGLLNMGFATWYRDPRDPSHGDPLLSAYVLARAALIHTGGFKSAGMHRRFAQPGHTAEHTLNVLRGLPELALFGGRWARERWIGSRTLPAFARRSASGAYRIRFDAEQSPDPESRVTLAKETDAFGVPRLSVRHRVSRSDRENYHRSLVHLADAIGASGWGSYDPPDLDEVLDLPFADATHQMGLLRMGTSPARSVVDPQLRAWSSPNLFCATTGVFPTSSHAGPTLTAVALAIRLADHLRIESRRRQNASSACGAN